ncbi:hypothetical protein O1L60_36060 [Streptomyces diastatochromogenes]|nr:hypothetical protein [Streptomyces diastatochromogenes]
MPSGSPPRRPCSSLPAQAAPGGARTTVTDLGPAIEQFALMSGILVGDTVYIGSRNLTPTRLIAFHLPTRRVVARTDLGTGHSVQALAADAAGGYLYAGILTKADEGGPNLFRWDLRTPDRPAVPVGRTEDRDVRELAVAPDGTVYAVGGVPGRRPRCGSTTRPPAGSPDSACPTRTPPWPGPSPPRTRPSSSGRAAPWAAGTGRAGPRCTRTTGRRARSATSPPGRWRRTRACANSPSSAAVSSSPRRERPSPRSSP